MRSHSAATKTVLSQMVPGRESSERLANEEFTLDFMGTSYSLQAHDPVSRAFGSEVAKVAKSSRFFTEFSGAWSPKTALRILWVSRIADREDLEGLCARVASLGYNAVALDEGQAEHADLRRALKSCGLKLVVRVDRSQIDPFWFLGTFAKPQLPAADYLLWEAAFMEAADHKPEAANALLDRDLAAQEIAALSATLTEGAALIYHVGCRNEVEAQKQALWLPRLAEQAKAGTAFAFSAVAGNPCDDHCPLHPLWTRMRTYPPVSDGAFIPIINAGGMGHGEGLWPLLNFDLINKACHYVANNPTPYAGLIAMTSWVPKLNSLQACNLWNVSQIVWRGLDAESAAEAWFRASLPEIDFGALNPLFREARSIAVEMGGLNSLVSAAKRNTGQTDPVRFKIDALLARLRNLETRLKEETDATELQVRFAFFFRDMRRMVYAAMQHFHIPAVNVLTNEDLAASFWTDAMHSPGQGGAAGAKVVIREVPHKGADNSAMRRIYAEASGVCVSLS